MVAIYQLACCQIYRTDTTHGRGCQDCKKNHDLQGMSYTLSGPRLRVVTVFKSLTRITAGNVSDEANGKSEDLKTMGDNEGSGWMRRAWE